MVDKAMQLYNLLIEQNIPVVGACPDVRKTGIPRVDYAPEATAEQKIIGDAIGEQFQKAIIVANGNIVTVTVDEQDTHVVFSAWLSPVGPFDELGKLQERKTIATVNGVASYEFDLTPGLYHVRAYGILTFMSGFMEVQIG
ncbi:MAG TPA: hypothetical protein ENI05_09410 [Porticoccus sp.]|nr:hypothetical protein [Porticoccus sp.]